MFQFAKWSPPETTNQTKLHKTQSTCLDKYILYRVGLPSNKMLTLLADIKFQCTKINVNPAHFTEESVLFFSPTSISYALKYFQIFMDGYFWSLSRMTY